MKSILITGLDGSGKSTLLHRLEEISDPERVAFIRVPKIDADLFRSNKELYNTTLFINKMHAEADRIKKPSLKVIALFSSMLVFRELEEHLKKDSLNLMVCERHPLIDTVVYARFYSSKMDPNHISLELLRSIESNYPEAVEHLFSISGSKSTGKGQMHSILSFIHDWFAIQKKLGTEDLKKIFKVDLPDKIIYLSASAVTLMERLKSRNILEAHESVEVLNKLIPVYEEVLRNSKVNTEIVDAESFMNLDLAFVRIKHDHFLDTSL